MKSVIIDRNLCLLSMSFYPVFKEQVSFVASLLRRLASKALATDAKHLVSKLL